jgi:demethylmenaquinone methyltransferase / 2-methoxy-6-polyprenyl-1,4-benzoquinol methylase
MVATSQPPLKLPGTRPEGARDEREAAARVQKMFGKIVPRYDFLNHLLSLSLDRVWRRRTARRFAHILRRPEARVLDLCCGTGDLALALDRERMRALASQGEATRRQIIGGDFVQPMLERAQEKARGGHYATAFVASDALNLPFEDARFDLLTTAFGFRNLSNYEKGLREFARVLTPGGEIGILEFSEPSAGLMAGVFRFYFRHILPRIGRIVSGNDEAYAYLPASVSKFPGKVELTAMMGAAGFSNVRVDSWNFGSVLLHSARRS